MDYPTSFSKGAKLELIDLAVVRGLKTPRFEVKDAIHGGMGVVLKLQHTDTKEIYALKAIKREYLGKESSWGRYIEELKWWLTLSAYDGVAEAYCITRVNEIPCMCAAWQHHGNLRQFIGRSKPKFIFETMLRIIRTLDWAYSEHKVIHRDLKPENILLDHDWKGCVSDWGLVKPLNTLFKESHSDHSLNENRSPQLTQTGQGVGTLLYAAPEQILGYKTVGIHSDMYSLGCMFFEWETGRPPFLGNTPSEIAQMQIQNPPPKLEGTTMLGLGGVINRCLEKDPANRFDSYDSLAKAIITAADQKGIRLIIHTPSERHHKPEKGVSDIHLQSMAQRIQKQEFSSVNVSEANALIKQSMAELALGNNEKAARLLAPFYTADICRNLRNWVYECHSIAMNYGLSLSHAHLNQSKAIEVFESLSGAEPKPPEYFINFSLALHRNNEYSKAESVAYAGLKIYPEDRGLLGNLTNSLRWQGKYSQALSTAKHRLKLGRDVHALEEIGGLLLDIGNSQEEDWPEATQCYKSAICYLEEAKALNSRYLPARANLVIALRKLYRFGDASDECSALREFSENRSATETSVCLFAELLNDSNNHRKCVDFCDEWIPVLTIDACKSWLQKTHARTLADHFMIGKNQQGKRVVIGSVVEFFQGKTESLENASESDLLYWARINEWMGHPEVALGILEVIMRKNPEWWEPFSFKAQLLFRQGDYEQAFNVAQESADMAPYRPEPLDNLATLYHSAGMIQKSNEAKEKADEMFAIRKKLCE